MPLPPLVKTSILNKIKNLPIDVGLGVRKYFVTNEVNSQALVATAQDDNEHPEIRIEALMNGNFPIVMLESVLDYVIANPLPNPIAHENMIKAIALVLQKRG